jgi:hypothetical protein
MPFFAPGCIYFLHLKYIFGIFENATKIQTKILCVHLHVLRAHKLVLRKKKTFYVDYIKMTKFSIKISFFATCFCLLCTAHKKCSTKLCVST